MNTNKKKNKFFGYSHSEGQVSMLNNVNGQQSRQQIGWDGDIKNVSPGHADIRFNTDWNGHRSNLNLKNAEITTISQNPKFKSFFNRLSRPVVNARTSMARASMARAPFTARRPYRKRWQARRATTRRRAFSRRRKEL